MSLSIVVAVNNKGYIGSNDKLLWKDKEDIDRLYEIIKDKVVILGRKTYEGYPRKGLERLYSVASKVVVCSSQRYRSDLMTYDFEEAINEFSDAYILGGAKIYDLAIKSGKVKFWYISRIDDDQIGDTPFPLELGF